MSHPSHGFHFYSRISKDEAESKSPKQTESRNGRSQEVAVRQGASETGNPCAYNTRFVENLRRAPHLGYMAFSVPHGAV